MVVVLFFCDSFIIQCMHTLNSFIHNVFSFFSVKNNQTCRVDAVFFCYICSDSKKVYYSCDMSCYSDYLKAKRRRKTRNTGIN